MAAGTKIVFEFKNAAGNTVRHSYNYGDASAVISDVKGYMTAAITNNTIFLNPPVVASRALVQVTTETEFNISDE